MILYMCIMLIGATLEGELRGVFLSEWKQIDKGAENGNLYSILSYEWISCKARLDQRMKR